MPDNYKLNNMGEKRSLRTVNVADIKETVKESLADERRELLAEFKKIIDERFSSFEDNYSKLENTINDNIIEISTLKSQVTDYIK